jgi:hypothetical protein
MPIPSGYEALTNVIIIVFQGLGMVIFYIDALTWFCDVSRAILAVKTYTARRK